MQGNLPMKGDMYWIDGLWPGRIAIALRPRGGDWLDDEVQAWRREGIDRAVSLLTPQEVGELGLTAEEDTCRAHDIKFVSFPIPDRGVPLFRSAALALINQLESALKTGERIALHCRQGIGRSALLAASLLVAAGDDTDTAFQ